MNLQRGRRTAISPILSEPPDLVTAQKTGRRKTLAVAAHVTVGADKSLLPIPVNKHIDGIVDLLNDGINSHSGESGIRFGSKLEYLE